MNKFRFAGISLAVVVVVVWTLFAVWGYNHFSRQILELQTSLGKTDQKIQDFISKTDVKITSSNGKLPFVTLSISPDNTITRTVIESEFAKSLTWNILRDGNNVLSRNAQNETKYKYYRSEPGLYTVYITAFIDGSYRVISNVVFYKIAENTQPEAKSGNF